MTFFLNVWKKRRRRTWLCVSSFFVLLWQLSFLEKNNIVKLAPLLLDLSQKTIDNATAISINISISTNATSQEWVAQSEDTLCSVISGSKLFHTNDNGGNVTYPKPQPFLPVSVLIPQSDKHQTAICHYHCPMHPPHFMQELVRCFSFWRSRPDQTPVLLVPKRQFYRYLTKPPAFLSRFPFSHGILEGLKQAIGLQVTKSAIQWHWPTGANIPRDGPGSFTLCHAFPSRCYRTA